MSEECDLEDVASILEDECSRTILAETSVEPMSASDLDDRLDASRPTIYRRIEDLEACDMIESRTRPDTEGHHHKVFVATFDRLTVDLSEGEYEYQVERTEAMADRFTRFIEQI